MDWARNVGSGACGRMRKFISVTASSSAVRQHASASRAGLRRQCRELSRCVANGPWGRWWPIHRAFARPIGVVLLFSLFLAASGAHDTDAAKWPQRMQYWLLMTGISAAVLRLCSFRARRRWPAAGPWKQHVVVALIMMMPLTGIAMTLCIFWFGGTPSIGRFSSLLPSMSSVIAALQVMLAGKKTFQATAGLLSAADTKDRGSRLLQHLPLPLCDADLLAVEAQDHYVRIHTSRGASLIRMRFADAIGLVPVAAGMQTHRSWWVGRDAVQSIRKRRKGAVITLINGMEVPASQKASLAWLGARSGNSASQIHKREG